MHHAQVDKSQQSYFQLLGIVMSVFFVSTHTHTDTHSNTHHHVVNKCVIPKVSSCFIVLDDFPQVFGINNFSYQPLCEHM